MHAVCIDAGAVAGDEKLPSCPLKAALVTTEDGELLPPAPAFPTSEEAGGWL